MLLSGWAGPLPTVSPTLRVLDAIGVTPPTIYMTHSPSVAPRCSTGRCPHQSPVARSSGPLAGTKQGSPVGPTDRNRGRSRRAKMVTPSIVPTSV